MKKLSSKNTNFVVAKLGVLLILIGCAIPVPRLELLNEMFIEKTSSSYDETNKRWIDSTRYLDGTEEIRRGKKDENGMWHGIINRELNGSETVAGFHHGSLHGTVSYYDEDDNWLGTSCFEYGERVDCGSVSKTYSKAGTTAYQVFSNKYSDYLYILNTVDFDNEYIENYADTIETLLAHYAFDEEEFNDNYDEIIEILEDTPYDSIIEVNAVFASSYGIESLKFSELRMAVIEHCRFGEPTYTILQTTYPGYIEALYAGSDEDTEIGDTEIESFCSDLDDSLSSYPPLNTSDPFFVDSVDSYMYKAVFNMFPLDDEELKAIQPSMLLTKSVLNDLYSKQHQVILSTSSSTFQKSASSSVAEVVVYYVFMEYLEGDNIKHAVKRAYLMNNGVFFPATVITDIAAHNSETSVTLEGHILDDGGAIVSARGIAWAAHYNPTIDDQVEPSGSGTGNFSITLDELTEGTAYYARTYGINSVDTAYGNCVKFIAGAPEEPITDNGIQTNIVLNDNFRIYPNPARETAWLNFNLVHGTRVSIQLYNMQGQEVYSHQAANLHRGRNRISLDISDLHAGTYVCQINYNDSYHESCKLLVGR